MAIEDDHAQAAGQAPDAPAFGDALAAAEEDRLRADFYDFLSGLLVRPPDAEKLQGLSGLQGDDHEIGQAIRALAKVAAATRPDEAEAEFTALFIGVGRGELQPFASAYLTGFLNEKPLASLREDMARLGMTRAKGVFEPEDNIGSLCEMMAGLIRGRFGAPADIETQAAFFNTHLGAWAGPFFTDLERAERSKLYSPVGALGRLLMDIEKEAFRLAQADREAAE